MFTIMLKKSDWPIRHRLVVYTSVLDSMSVNIKYRSTCNYVNKVLNIVRAYQPKY